MEPIRVPAPPKQAFNKHRRVSDLIRKQVNHFKHLEQRLPEHLRSEIPQHQVVTEDDAARYVASITAVLLSRSLATSQPSPSALQPSRSALKKPAKSPTRGLSLVAAAEPTQKTAARGSKPAKKAGESPRKGKKK
jgi:hypothetical protein